jgi:hypothetical protein
VIPETRGTRIIEWHLRIAGMEEPAVLRLSFDAELPQRMPDWADGPAAVSGMLQAIQVIAVRRLHGQIDLRRDFIVGVDRALSDEDQRST